MNAYTNFRSHSHATPNRRVPLGLFALILASLAVLSLAGCVGLTGAGKPAAKSSSSSSGTLAASATSLSFGSVVAGSSTPQPLTLTNTATAAVTISQVASGQNHAFQV